MYKLSDRAITLLTLVNDRTVWYGDERPGDRLQNWFVPSYTRVYSESLPDGVFISGSGDAKIFKSLQNKGLIKKQGNIDYSYSITEDGILALAESGKA